MKNEWINWRLKQNGGDVVKELPFGSKREEAERSEVKLESQPGIESLVGIDYRKRGAKKERERAEQQWWESRECFKWQASKRLSQQKKKNIGS